jgi:hypothetical protein
MHCPAISRLMTPVKRERRLWWIGSSSSLD